MFIQTCVMHKPLPPVTVLNPSFYCHPNYLHSNVSLSSRFSLRLAVSAKSDLNPEPEPSSNSESAKPKPRNRRPKTEVPGKGDENVEGVLRRSIPKKPRRGRKSEAAAVEDFVRESLERTFASIRQQNSDVLDDNDSIMKDRVDGGVDSDRDDSSEDEDEDEDDDDVSGKGKKMVVEEDSANWPIDAEVGYGIRASEYFEQHSIKNVVGEDGVEIDWEGEVDDCWVKEINCLEWESFAFHPSPLIVLVFERYNRASDNWKVLKELEKAAKVYWSAKDRLPPRMVKVDINIERDLAYALKVKEGPQVLFLRGNKILYREKEVRSSDELVHMIAHFYYKAKKPSWIDVAALSLPY